MKKRVLVISDHIEHVKWRGIESVTLNIIDSLKNSGKYEVGYLSSVSFKKVREDFKFKLPILGIFNYKSRFFIYGMASKAQHSINIINALTNGIINYYTELYSNSKLNTFFSKYVIGFLKIGRDVLFLPVLVNYIKSIFLDLSYFIRTEEINLFSYKGTKSLIKRTDFVISWPFINILINKNHTFISNLIVSKICRKYKIDVLIIAHPSCISYKSINTKLVTFYHDLIPLQYPENRHPRLSLFTNEVYRSFVSSDMILYNSKETYNSVNNFFKDLQRPERKDIVTYIYPNIELDNYNLLSSELFSIVKSRYKIKKGKYFIFISALEYRKNIFNLYDAAKIFTEHQIIRIKKKYESKLVKLKGKNLRMLQYKMEKELKNIFKFVFVGYNSFNLPSSENIIFTDYINEDEKLALLVNAYALVAPSYYEGFGIPIIEAMTLKVPVISSLGGAQKEIANEDNSIIIKNPDNYGEIYQVLKFAAQNPDILKLKVEKAYNFVIDNFSKEKIQNNFVEAIDSLFV